MLLPARTGSTKHTAMLLPAATLIGQTRYPNSCACMFSCSSFEAETIGV